MWEQRMIQVAGLLQGLWKDHMLEVCLARELVFMLPWSRELCVLDPESCWPSPWIFRNISILLFGTRCFQGRLQTISHQHHAKQSTQFVEWQIRNMGISSPPKHYHQGKRNISSVLFSLANNAISSRVWRGARSHLELELFLGPVVLYNNILLCHVCEPMHFHRTKKIRMCLIVGHRGFFGHAGC